MPAYLARSPSAPEAADGQLFLRLNNGDNASYLAGWSKVGNISANGLPFRRGSNRGKHFRAFEPNLSYKIKWGRIAIWSSARSRNFNPLDLLHRVDHRHMLAVVIFVKLYSAFRMIVENRDFQFG